LRFAGLKNIFKIHLQLQLEACSGGVFMEPSWQLEVKMEATIFLRPENESTQSYFEIWPFGCLDTQRFR
jgi:hypothetical protein